LSRKKKSRKKRTSVPGHPRARADRGIDRSKALDDSSGVLLGKQIVTYGERNDPYRFQRWNVPGGSLRTDNPTEVFRARVKPYSLDSIVSAAARLTRDRARDERGFINRLHDAGMTRATFAPFIIRQLVTRAIAEHDLPDTATSEIGARAFHNAEAVLMDVAAVAVVFPKTRDSKNAGRWRCAFSSTSITTSFPTARTSAISGSTSG